MKKKCMIVKGNDYDTDILYLLYNDEKQKKIVYMRVDKSGVTNYDDLWSSHFSPARPGG